MLVSLITALALAHQPAADAGVGSTVQPVRYGWCMASEPTYGRYHLFSSVFRVAEGTYHVGVQNSFLSFAQAYDGRAYGVPASCSVTFSTWQEAEDDKNQWMARKRSLGHGVSWTNWSYHGG